MLVVETFLCFQGGTQSFPCCQQAEGFQEGGGLDIDNFAY